MLASRGKVWNLVGGSWFSSWLMRPRMATPPRRWVVVITTALEMRKEVGLKMAMTEAEGTQKDGKDGLVSEAMKLFQLMREKGTIPEVVIYTAVVEGFCKAHKFDDARRIFRKMQTNGISPNIFSYTVLIQGLFKYERLEEAVEFCEEMREVGHSPDLASFLGLAGIACKEKDVKECRAVIKTLGQKGFCIDNKTVRNSWKRSLLSTL